MPPGFQSTLLLTVLLAIGLVFFLRAASGTSSSEESSAAGFGLVFPLAAALASFLCFGASSCAHAQWNSELRRSDVALCGVRARDKMASAPRSNHQRASAVRGTGDREGEGRLWLIFAK